MTYSGTVAGAMEGASLGLPSIALSQAYGPVGHDEAFWDCAETHAPGLIGKILGAGHPARHRHQCEFSGLPAGGGARGRGHRSGPARRANRHRSTNARMGAANPITGFPLRAASSTPGHGTDLEALAQNKISVTPLKLDLTDEPALAHLAQALR